MAEAAPHPIRLDGLSETIRESYPSGELFEWIVLGITELGEDPAIILLLALAYWVVERESVAALASYVTAGIAFVLVLKSVFGMARPPEELWLVAREYDPYGFPSGHAFNATVLYGGALYLFDRLRRPPLAAVLLGLVAAISLSRVVLGYHYFGDIIAGIAVGTVFVAVLDRAVARNPVRGFAVAVLVAIPAIVLSDGDPFGYIALGAGIGGLVAATQLDRVPSLRSRGEAVLLTVGGLVALVAIVVVQELFVPNTPGLVVAHAAIVAVVLLAPVGSSRLHRVLWASPSDS